MTNIKRIFCIGYALDCIIVTYGNVAIEKDGFSVLINSDDCTPDEITNLVIAIEALLESHGFENDDSTKNAREFKCEELETTVTLTIV
jgi:NAD-dependent dihydropyrimidine dehydrogenase PreA subunit